MSEHNQQQFSQFEGPEKIKIDKISFDRNDDFSNQNIPEHDISGFHDESMMRELHKGQSRLNEDDQQEAQEQLEDKFMGLNQDLMPEK